MLSRIGERRGESRWARQHPFRSSYIPREQVRAAILTRDHSSANYGEAKVPGASTRVEGIVKVQKGTSGLGAHLDTLQGRGEIIKTSV